MFFLFNVSHICCDVKPSKVCRAVSLLSMFRVVTFAPGTTSCHIALLLLQSHSAANVQLHKFLC
jgi:hypothetical protein